MRPAPVRPLRGRNFGSQESQAESNHGRGDRAGRGQVPLSPRGPQPSTGGREALRRPWRCPWAQSHLREA